MELRDDGVLLDFLVCHYAHRIEEVSDVPAGYGTLTRTEREADAFSDDAKLTALLSCTHFDCFIFLHRTAKLYRMSYTRGTTPPKSYSHLGYALKSLTVL